MAQRNDFRAFQREATKVIKDLPKMMGKMALVEVSDNFKRQGYEDEAGAVVPWEPRKAGKKERGRTRNDGGRDRRYKVPRGRAILVQTARLKRSPRIESTTATSVTIATDVPYAQPLQEGTEHMKPRPFMTVGKSFRDKVVRQTAARIEKLLTR